MVTERGNVTVQNHVFVWRASVVDGNKCADSNEMLLMSAMFSITVSSPTRCTPRSRISTGAMVSAPTRRFRYRRSVTFNAVPSSNGVWRCYHSRHRDVRPSLRPYVRPSRNEALLSNEWTWKRQFWQCVKVCMPINFHPDPRRPWPQIEAKNSNRVHMFVFKTVRKHSVADK